jgi:Clp amino terminal domain, pathogenicity island component
MSEATVENFVHLDGRVTPRLEAVLRRAAAIAYERGYHYLGVEHVALAIAEDGQSLPVRARHDALTVEQWQGAIVAGLPDLASGDHLPSRPPMVRADSGRR